VGQEQRGVGQEARAPMRPSLRSREVSMSSLPLQLRPRSSSRPSSYEDSNSRSWCNTRVEQSNVVTRGCRNACACQHPLRANTRSVPVSLHIDDAIQLDTNHTCGKPSFISRYTTQTCTLQTFQRGLQVCTTCRLLTSHPPNRPPHASFLDINYIRRTAPQATPPGTRG
jgi:hypothetical protein